MKVIEKIKQWHYDRNLIEGSTDLDQFGKLMEEVMELHEALVSALPTMERNKVWLLDRGDEIPDAIGDIMVVLINIAERNGLTIEQCLEHAYNDIKHRKGKMVDGLFVKE
jgi:NTP pyrophosphatase (non-canonical NTP hydrolase)